MQRMWCLLAVTLLLLQIESVSLAKSWLSPNGIVHASGSVARKVVEIPLSAGRFVMRSGQRIIHGLGADKIPSQVRTTDAKLGNVARSAITPVRNYVIQPISRGVVQPTRQRVGRTWPFTMLSKSTAGSK